MFSEGRPAKISNRFKLFFLLSYSERQYLFGNSSRFCVDWYWRKYGSTILGNIEISVLGNPGHFDRPNRQDLPLGDVKKYLHMYTQTLIIFHYFALRVNFHTSCMARLRAGQVRVGKCWILSVWRNGGGSVGLWV